MPETRLDVRVSETLGITRSRAAKLIRGGQVTVDGKVSLKPGFPVTEGNDVLATLPPPQIMEARPEDIALAIVYEDAHMAVVNKPAGMVVHPAAGNASGTLVNALLYHLHDLSGIGGTLRPGIVHRLDKDTSGLLLIAKDDAAHLALSRALKERTIHKTYLAVCAGTWKEPEGVIDAPIARHPADRKRMAVRQGGREARTVYRVKEAFHGAALMEIDLITGRTHQIRVHMAYKNHPLLGDCLYGGRKPAQTAPRLMLHAWRLALSHPLTGEPLQFTAPPPVEFEAVVTRLRQ